MVVQTSTLIDGKASYSGEEVIALFAAIRGGGNGDRTSIRMQRK